MNSQQPAAARAQIDRALGAFRARDRDLAASIVAEIVAADPPLGVTWGPVSRLALGLGEITSAIVAAERHAALDHGDIVARLTLAQMLARHGRSEQAKTVAAALAADHARQPAAWHLLGSCRAELGEAAAAEADFRRAIALTPDLSAATLSWLAIAEAKRFGPDDEDLKSMEALRDRWPEGRPPEARAALLYAIGKAHDDLGHADRAFASYEAGARLVAGVRSKGRDEATTFVDEIVSGFSREALRSLGDSDVRSRRPIFVLGLPRSGTTLVEQILVSHSEVADGAEVNLFRAAAIPIGGFSPGTVAAFAASRPDGLSGVGQAYLGLLEQRFGDQGRVVDKTLNHSRYLGLIHRALPEARFIWMRRDAGATAWSCFRTWFAQGVDWSWSLKAMGQYFQDEDRLHAHWTAVMGEAILTVPYEGLVSDPQVWIARVLDHVGLPFEAGVEAFHKTRRAVTTASFAQVRQPIHTTSRDAWRRYETHMKPFFDAYARP